MERSAKAEEIIRRHGVFATPPPLAAYVVRAVHHLLRSRFGQPDGLAAREVRVLDPAAGSMSFILEAWRVALEQSADGKDLIRGHLLPHFQGIELLADEWLEGHRKVKAFLNDRGYLPGAGECVSLHLADALAEPKSNGSDWIENVVIGNPPWVGSSSRRGHWIQGLLKGYCLPDGTEDEGCYRVDGEPLGERNPKWLQDDYVKFLRMAQWMIHRNGSGIVAFVVNHNCLEAPTFRGLRRSMLRTFDEVYALDLHGNRRRKETAPDGSVDESVFPGVAQGAAVLILVRRKGLGKKVFRADLFGSRQSKLAALGAASLESTGWTEVRPCSPLYRFAGLNRRAERSFREGLSLPEIFPVSSAGVITGRDALVTDIDRRAIEARVSRLEKGRGPAWGLAPRHLSRLRADPGWPRHLTRCTVRPFDVRHIVLAPYLVERPRQAVMSHMQRGQNLGLIVSRQCKEEPGAFVTRWTSGHKVVSPYDLNTLFPLYLYTEPGAGPVANISQAVLAHLGNLYGTAPQPEEVLGYVYAVLHSPGYRKRFREQLRHDFPRLSFPREASELRRLGALGAQLVTTHLLEDPRATALPVHLEGDVNLPLTRNRQKLGAFDEKAGRVLLNGEGLCFRAIEPEVWRYRIGSYPVLERWLKARAGRVLSPTEARDFGRIAAALRQTLVLQSRIENHPT